MWKEQVLLRTAEETMAPPEGTEWLINALTTVDIYMSTSAALAVGYRFWKLTIKPCLPEG